MEAEDVQCCLLYRNERATIARECGHMLTEERAVRNRGLFWDPRGRKSCRVLQPRNIYDITSCVARVCAKQSRCWLTYNCVDICMYACPLCHVLSQVRCTHYHAYVQVLNFVFLHRRVWVLSQPDPGDDARRGRYCGRETASGKDSCAGQGNGAEAGHDERHLRASKSMGRLQGPSKKRIGPARLNTSDTARSDQNKHESYKSA